jgi:hypothetical protein
VTIDPDVRGVALEASNSLRFAALLQAVVQAEGGRAAIVRAVQCSAPSVQELTPALRILAKSAVHQMIDFIVDRGDAEAFVQTWATRWAPVGVANDPHGLNAAWPHNVLSAWKL